MTPAAERKAAERQRRKDAGLVAVTVYVRPEDRQAVRDFVASITPPADAPPTVPDPA